MSIEEQKLVVKLYEIKETMRKVKEYLNTQNKELKIALSKCE